MRRQPVARSRGRQPALSLFQPPKIALDHPPRATTCGYLDRRPCLLTVPQRKLTLAALSHRSATHPPDCEALANPTGYRADSYGSNGAGLKPAEPNELEAGLGPEGSLLLRTAAAVSSAAAAPMAAQNRQPNRLFFSTVRVMTLLCAIVAPPLSEPLVAVTSMKNSPGSVLGIMPPAVARPVSSVVIVMVRDAP